MADIIELKPVNKVQNIINKFCYTIGMLPTSYKASMTYEEQLVAIGNYLEETVIPALNNNAEVVAELQNLYIELKNYVDNYFNDLDVQEEINKKLDEMGKNGELKTILDTIFQELNNNINELNNNIINTNSNLNEYQTTNNTAIQNLQNQINSLTVPDGNEDVSNAEIIQARTNTMAHTFSTLNDRINFIEKTLPFNYRNINDCNFDEMVTPGKFLVINSVNNPINDDKIGSGFLEVIALNPNNWNPTNFQWILQKWYPINYNGFACRIIYRNSLDPISYTFNEWKITDNTKIGNLIYRANLYDYYNSVNVINSNTDFNNIIKDGLYIVTVSNNNNNPFNSSGFLEVNTFQMTSVPWIYCHQVYMDIYLNKKAERIIRISQRGENPIIGEWKITYNSENNLEYFSLKGKNIVNFGDSIFGNYRDNTSISNQIANVTKATLTNLGFGGTQMSLHERSEFNPFSFCNLVDAIISKDWSTQETSVNNRPHDMPTYFSTSLTTLKNIDFTKIDYITLSYGTNDYANGNKLDNDDNPYDKNTFAGALRYSIEKILSAFPNLRILIGTPIWRCWINDDKTQVIETSDEKTFEGDFTLPQMIEKIKEIAKNYHIPIVDTYNNLSLNKFNWSNFYSSDDTVHPKEFGRYCIAKEYGYKLLSM